MYIVFRLRSRGARDNTNVSDAESDMNNCDNNIGVNMYKDGIVDNEISNVNMYIDEENPRRRVYANVKRRRYIKWSHKKERCLQRRLNGSAPMQWQSIMQTKQLNSYQRHTSKHVISQCRV